MKTSVTRVEWEAGERGRGSPGEGLDFPFSDVRFEQSNLS